MFGAWKRRTEERLVEEYGLELSHISSGLESALLSLEALKDNIQQEEGHTMAEKPFAPVVEALAAQTRAINQLARELKEEFAQYQSAVQSRDNKRAAAIASAINQRTARLVEATDKLEQSVPDAAPGQGLPGGPPATPGQDLPDREEGITDPGYGQGAGNRPDAGLPPSAGRPDQGLPPSPGRPDQGLPPSPGRPDQGLPPSAGRPDQGLPPSPGRPDQGLPPAPARPDQGLPNAPVRPGTGPVPPEGGTKPVDPDAPEAGQELPEGGDSAGGEVDNTLPPSGETKPVEPSEGGEAQPK